MASRILGRVLAYLLSIAIAEDILIDAIFGGRPYQTISCRIGLSIETGGWASHVKWPAWWVAHCVGSVFLTTV